MRRLPVVSAVSALAVILLAVPSGARAAGGQAGAGQAGAGAVKEPVAVGSGGRVASMDLDANQARIDPHQRARHRSAPARLTESSQGRTHPVRSRPAPAG